MEIKILTLLALSIGLASCGHVQSQDTTESLPQTIELPDGFEILIIDECEYLFHEESWAGKSHTESLCHKGNCKNKIHSR